MKLLETAANNQFRWIRSQVEYEVLHDLAQALARGLDG
jgi:hypothetical protein